MPHRILETSDNISKKRPFEDLFNQFHKLWPTPFQRKSQVVKVE